MVIFGGLEIIAGGYIYHRYHKSKNEKKRLEHEAQQRRHHSFPGAKPQPCYASHPEPAVGPHKYGYVAHAPPHRPPPPGPHPPHPPPHRPRTEPPPHRPHHAPHAHAHGHASPPPPQPFLIPRRPLPAQQHAPPPQLIQPLQRADSMATLSRMPIANGYRPSHVADDDPLRPPRRQNAQLSPVAQSPMRPPYASPGFALSSPALAGNPAPQTYSPVQPGGRQTVDDNWETYNSHAPGYPPHAPSVSTALGEPTDDDPPPPYRP